MRHIDRILLKIITMQFIILIIVQILVHQWPAMTILQKITYYEGVNTMDHGEIIETINGSRDR
ncbi:DUF5359 family protein [Bacillus spongiae]|uniref:DUF5359 family protein n=1 Tax=Bacillus spongiae TaxID=2683610 RepID=A0ABU8HCV0_9BACI